MNQQRTAAIREAIAMVETDPCLCADTRQCVRCEHLEHLRAELREAEVQDA